MKSQAEMNSPAHLLNLPRELRDRIYAYLHHQIDFYWDRDGIIAPRGNEGELQLLEPLPIRLEKCPLPYVFRIHPRIYEEYHELYVKDLTALIDPSLPVFGAARFRALPDSSDRNNAIFARLRHISLFLTIHAKSSSSSLDWENQITLLHALTAKAPELSTLRVAVRQQYHLSSGPTVNDQDLESVLLPTTVRLDTSRGIDFLPQMPDVISDMPLVQRGEGYHIGHGGTYQLIPQSTIPQLITIIFPNRSYIITHGIRKIGVYTYSCDADNCAKHMWTAKDIVARWAMRKYPSSIRQIVSDERADWLMKLPYEMAEWVEKRGVEKVKNWFGEN